MEQSQWASKSEAEEQKESVSQRATSALSATTPSFQPATSDSQEDPLASEEFAVTATTEDDLFDDVVELDSSAQVRAEDDLFADDFTPAELPIVEESTQRVSNTRGRGRGRGQPRARARGAGTTGTRANPTQAGSALQHSHGTDSNRSAQSQPPENAPAGPRKETVAAVRGDRRATGGVRKPKLSEEELAEKMAKIQIKNASLTAAHVRAEADAASFARREEKAKQIAAQRQTQERKDRQQMMGERERNRLRKLKAMEGREWDAEKNEDDFRRGGRFDKKTAAQTEPENASDGREYLYKEPRAGGREKGGQGNAQAKPQSAPRLQDFPSLPSKPKSSTEKEDGIDGSRSKSSQPISWADQVESSRSKSTKEISAGQ